MCHLAFRISHTHVLSVFTDLHASGYDDISSYSRTYKNFLHNREGDRQVLIIHELEILTEVKRTNYEVFSTTLYINQDICFSSPQLYISVACLISYSFQFFNNKDLFWQHFWQCLHLARYSFIVYTSIVYDNVYVLLVDSSSLVCFHSFGENVFQFFLRNGLFWLVCLHCLHARAGFVLISHIPLFYVCCIMLISSS